MTCMFGIPQDHRDQFLEAWRESFTGFDLEWIEVEICRQAMKMTNVGELFERLKKTYPMLEDWHHSRFYRIVQNLEAKNYLVSETEGRSKLITTTPKGVKEVGRITRYFVEIAIEEIKYELWTDLIHKITPFTGCLLDQRVIVVGPEYQTVKILARECRVCPIRSNDPISKHESELLNNFIFLDINSDIKGKTQESTIIEAEINDWPFKASYADIVIIFTALNSFAEHRDSIIQEAARVTKKKGIIVLFEITKMTSRVVLRFLRQAAMLLNIAHPGDAWKIPDELISGETIEKIIQQNSDVKLLKALPEMINSVYILQTV